MIAMKKLLLISLFSILASCGGGGAGTAADAGSEEAYGALIASANLGRTVVGEKLWAKVNVIPLGAGNELQSLEAINATTGGSTPVIDAQGNLTWTPNDADFVGTTYLTIVAKTSQGGETAQKFAIEVTKKRQAISVDLAADDSSYSDEEGQYVVAVSRRVASQPITGHLILTEFLSKTGLSGWEIETTDSNESVWVNLLRAPSTNSRAANQLTTQATSVYPLDEIGSLGGQLIVKDGSALEGLGANLYSSRPTHGLGYGYFVGRNIHVVSDKSHRVFDFFSSCGVSLKRSCESFAGAPVILIHGFAGGDGVGLSASITGGGEGTWGLLPDALIQKDHPVFEMRWHTYMRFEEAAGKLAEFSMLVAKVTRKKPVIIAHSFGGVVSHLMLESEGIRYRGLVQGQWEKVSYENQVSRLITLNSPLSGINHPLGSFDRNDYIGEKLRADGGSFSMTRGVDHTDKMIGMCYSITCLQAGALLPSEEEDGHYLRLKAALISGFGSGLIDSTISTGFYSFVDTSNLVWEGESIKRLQDGLSNISTPVFSFVGFQDIGEDGWNRLHGDGLISLIGQAATPPDFAYAPFNLNSEFEYKFVGAGGGGTLNFPLYHSGSNGVVLSGRAAFSELRAGDCLKYIVQGRTYAICARSAHTGGFPSLSKRLPGLSDFSIAHLGDEDSGLVHPLRTLINDPDWLNMVVPELYLGGVEELVQSQYQGLLVAPANSVLSLQASSPVAGVVWYSKLTNKVTGQSSNDFGGAMTDQSGHFSIDVAKMLSEGFGATAKREDYSLQLKVAVSGYEPLLLNIADIQGGSIDLGTIELKTLGSLVSVSGQVADDGSGVALPGAEVRIAQGESLSADAIKMRTDVVNGFALRTARKINSDASGHLQLTSLRAGVYSVLVSKSGYATRLYGNVVVVEGGAMSFRLAPQTLEPIDLAAAVTGGFWGIAEEAPGIPQLSFIKASGAPTKGVYTLTGQQFRVQGGAWTPYVRDTSNDTQILTSSGWQRRGAIGGIETIEQLSPFNFLFKGDGTEQLFKISQSSPSQISAEDMYLWFRQGTVATLPVGAKAFRFEASLAKELYSLEGDAFQGYYTLEYLRQIYSESSGAFLPDLGPYSLRNGFVWRFGSGESNGTLYLYNNFPMDQDCSAIPDPCSAPTPASINGTWQVVVRNGVEMLELNIPASDDQTGMSQGQKIFYSIGLNGHVQQGRYLPAGTPIDSFLNLNGIGMNGLLSGLGLPALP